MWSHGSRARVGRVLRGLAEALTLASALVALIPFFAPFVVLGAGFALGHAWLDDAAAGAIVVVALEAVLVMYPLRGAVRVFLYGYRYRQCEIRYALDGGGPGVDIRTVRLRARIVRTGIRMLRDRYCYSAPEGRRMRRRSSVPGGRAADARARRSSGLTRRWLPHAPKVMEGEATVHGVIWDTAARCWNYLIDLGAPLPAGSERQIELEQELDFRGAAYVPVFQRTISDPTDELVMVLQLPSSQWPIEAEGEREGGRRPGRRRLPVTIDPDHSEVRLVVRRPHFGATYRINWYSVRRKPAPDEQVSQQDDLRALRDNPTRSEQAKS